MPDQDITNSDVIKAAFDADRRCPKEERLVAYARGLLPATEAKSVADHAETCGRCAESIAISQELVAAESEISSPAVQGVVGQLRNDPAWARDATDSVPSRSRNAWLLAAAVLVAAGLGLTQLDWFSPTAPELPAPGPTHERGTTIDVAAPRGILAMRPSELRWKTSQDPMSYQATILDVAGNTVFTCAAGSVDTTTGGNCPIDAASPLRPFAVYRWQVQAFAPADSRLEDRLPSASSTWVEFSFSPQ